PGRLDDAAKVTGRAIYGVDATLPKMLYGSVEYPPHVGAEPVSVDDVAALTVPGVRRVVPLADGVGVVADSTWAARRGRAALTGQWSTPDTPTYDSEATKADALRIANDPSVDGLINRAQGDVAAARGTAAHVLTADFVSEHVTHACMEPMTAVVAELADTRPIRVLRYWAAVDPGLAIHPGNVVAQIEGALTMGTSIALREAVPFVRGKPQCPACATTGFCACPRHRKSRSVCWKRRISGRRASANPASPPAAAAIANAALATWDEALSAMPFKA
ncbi:MAG: molybdopterin cofactor-binding domain-containing protein, partial [Qingshengfaniella sp.]